MGILAPERPTMGQAAVRANSRTRSRRTNWWLRLTSSGWQGPQRTLEERERARRSRLASWIILGLLIVEVIIVPAGANDLATLEAVGIALIGTLLAALLNRLGSVTGAGSLLVVLVWAAILGSLASAPGAQLDTINLPAYDLLVVAVIVGASILPRIAAFVIATINIALIVVDFSLQPKVGDLLHWMTLEGPVPLIARPIALQVIIAVVAYLWVRGTDDAIRRADRAEEIATLEHSIAEQKRQLDIGIQQLLATHIRAANGDFSARAPLRQENVLWQIASSLNNLLARMQRTAQAEHQLVRTEEELRRLAAAIDEAQAGRAPFWPMPTGTAADLILERIARSQRRRSVPTAPYEQGQVPSGFGAPSMSSRPVGGAPYLPAYGPGHGQGRGQDYGQDYGQGPADPSQPLGQPPYGPGGFGAPQPSSQPVGHPMSQPPMPPRYGQGGFGAAQPSSTPLGQSQQTTGRWQPPATPSSESVQSQDPTAPEPWMLSREELAQEAHDLPRDTSRDTSREEPQDWPELPPMGQWPSTADPAEPPRG